MNYCPNCGKPINDAASSRKNLAGKVVIDITTELKSYSKKTTGELNAIGGKIRAAQKLNKGLSAFFSKNKLPIDTRKEEFEIIGMELYDLFQEVMILGETRDLEFSDRGDVYFKQHPLVRKALMNKDPHKAAVGLLEAVDEGALGEYMWS